MFQMLDPKNIKDQLHTNSFVFIVCTVWDLLSFTHDILIIKRATESSYLPPPPKKKVLVLMLGYLILPLIESIDSWLLEGTWGKEGQNKWFIWCLYSLLSFSWWQ